MNTKKEIRKELLKKRNTLAEEQREKYSKLIQERLFFLPEYMDSEIILTYISYQSEVSTLEIINHALKEGKKVFCPKVLEAGIMEFYEITSLKVLICGYKNIPEPQQTDSVFSFSDDNISNTLMIMPVVGYDAKKNRLGYGGGFYDRYIQRFPQLKRIGLAFECQRYDSLIPYEETDFKPDFIITENNCF